MRTFCSPGERHDDEDVDKDDDDDGDDVDDGDDDSGDDDCEDLRQKDTPLGDAPSPWGNLMLCTCGGIRFSTSSVREIILLHI